MTVAEVRRAEAAAEGRAEAAGRSTARGDGGRRWR